MPEPRDAMAARIRRQAAWCAELGSPMYASLLRAAAGDLENDGPVWDVLREYAQEPGTAAVPLRLMAAVHRLVLDETLPELATHYPSTGGDGDANAAWPLFRQALVDQGDRLDALIGRGCQTNEVGRSAALLGGFLEVAHRTHQPLRILELGASAGLNLRWDLYRYESPRGAWGDPGSPVRFVHAFEVPPELSRTAEVSERKGCDLDPIDPTSDEGALALRSFVWADQLGRLALLDGAIEVARGMPVVVEKADAADFLDRELARPHRGVATVVYHSVFVQYVPEAERRRIATAIAGARVYHLSMEPTEAAFEIRLNGELLGLSRAHGTHVHWKAN